MIIGAVWRTYPIHCKNKGQINSIENTSWLTLFGHFDSLKYIKIFSVEMYSNMLSVQNVLKTRPFDSRVQKEDGGHMVMYFHKKKAFFAKRKKNKKTMGLINE